MSYIDRELLLIGVDGCISSLHVQAKGDPIQESAIKLVEATRDYIASLSAADVVEVRHGRWDENGRCTLCGGHAPFWAMASTYYKSPWCHECGARMDKEDEP